MNRWYGVVGIGALVLLGCFGYVQLRQTQVIDAQPLVTSTLATSTMRMPIERGILADRTESTCRFVLVENGTTYSGRLDIGWHGVDEMIGVYTYGKDSEREIVVLHNQGGEIYVWDETFPDGPVMKLQLNEYTRTSRWLDMDPEVALINTDIELTCEDWRGGYGDGEMFFYPETSTAVDGTDGFGQAVFLNPVLRTQLWLTYTE